MTHNDGRTGENHPVDEDLLLATVDLVGRSGAKNFEIGWLNDPGEPAYEKHGPQWWIKAQYKGARLITENHPGPNEACDAFGVQILTGAKCKCGKLVALSASGAIAYDDVLMADGSTWTAERARKAGQCRWVRRGPRWKRYCE